MHVEAKRKKQIIAKLFIVFSADFQSGLAEWPNDDQVKKFAFFYTISWTII